MTAREVGVPNDVVTSDRDAPGKRPVNQLTLSRLEVFYWRMNSDVDGRWRRRHGSHRAAQQNCGGTSERRSERHPPVPPGKSQLLSADRSVSLRTPPMPGSLALSLPVST